MLKELESESLRIGIVSSESNRNRLKSYDAHTYNGSLVMYQLS